MSESPSLEDKRALLERAVEAMRSELSALQSAATDAVAGATHPDNRPENSKDMRSTEASYVAAGTGARVLALTHALALCSAVPAKRWGAGEAVHAGALVKLEDLDEQDPPAWYLLMPEGGGIELSLSKSKQRVRVLTPRSPLGEALVGKAQGDSIEVDLRGARRSFELTEVV